MNTHESYVSLTTAKLLKEAGFDWSSFAYYDTNNILCLSEVLITKESSDLTEHINCLAPTLAVAQRWLREVMKIEVFIEPFVGFYKYAVEELKEDGVYSDGREKSYEEAQEAGVKKALEMILEKGE